MTSAVQQHQHSSTKNVHKRHQARVNQFCQKLVPVEIQEAGFVCAHA